MKPLVIHTDTPKSNDAIVLFDSFARRLCVSIFVDNRTKISNIEINKSDVDRIIEYLQNYKQEFL